jgi:succinate dehydrogenase / fumarate reductase iron-sulfur subunit
MGALRRFRVWRGDDSGGQLSDFKVEVNDGEVVLDVIHRLQATQTPDLAVRWNCKAGKCGSCSMEINGKPRLSCMTRMSTFAPDETVTITPLRTFPVIRDLVTDVSFNYAKARELPAFAPPPGVQPGEYRMKQVDVDRSQEFRKCIECFLCQNTCHVVRDHDDNKAAFSGPRLFIRAAELDMHPLDAITNRKNFAQEQQGLGYCNITKCCTEVCPEHIKITDNAIIPMKERVVDNKYDPLVWLGRKIFRRDQLATESTRAWNAPAPRPTAAAAPAHHTVGPEVPSTVVPRNVVWHRPAKTALEAEVGPDGKLPLTEFTIDRAGAASPFGDELIFPLPADSLGYQHPDHETGHETGHESDTGH